MSSYIRKDLLEKALESYPYDSAVDDIREHSDLIIDVAKKWTQFVDERVGPDKDAEPFKPDCSPHKMKSITDAIRSQKFPVSFEIPN